MFNATVYSDKPVKYTHFFQELLKSPYNEFKLIIHNDDIFSGKFEVIDNKVKISNIKFTLYYIQQDDGDTFVSKDDQYVLLDIDNNFLKVEDTEDIELYSIHNQFIRQPFASFFYTFFYN